MSETQAISRAKRRSHRQECERGYVNGEWKAYLSENSESFECWVFIGPDGTQLEMFGHAEDSGDAIRVLEALSRGWNKPERNES